MASQGTADLPREPIPGEWYSPKAHEGCLGPMNDDHIRQLAVMLENSGEEKTRMFLFLNCCSKEQANYEIARAKDVIRLGQIKGVDFQET